MKLITKAIEKKFEKYPLCSQDGKGMDAKVVLKIFDPCGSYTMYVTEADLEEGTLFGFVTGLSYPELGYASLEELTSYRGRFGLGMERDIHFDSGKNTIQECVEGRL